MSSRINHLAVLVSAIVFFLFGGLWYMPLFGHQWTALTGAGKTMPPISTYVAAFILGWIVAYVMASIMADSAHANPARHGIELGAIVGIGVFGTMALMDYLYEGRSLQLWAINAGYVAVGMAIMGGIIGAWRKKEVPAAA